MLKEVIYNRKISYKVINLIYVVFISFISIVCLFDYTTYDNYTGLINNKILLLQVPIDRTNTLIDNNTLIFNNKNYFYQIKKISDLYVENNITAYQDIVLEIKLDKKYLINNNILDFKIKKEKKKVVSYIITYLKERSSI